MRVNILLLIGLMEIILKKQMNFVDQMHQSGVHNNRYSDCKHTNAWKQETNYIYAFKHKETKAKLQKLPMLQQRRNEKYLICFHTCKIKSRSFWCFFFIHFHLELRPKKRVYF